MMIDEEKINVNGGFSPAELKARRQWVVWKYEDHGKPKLDKVPYNPRTGQRAKSNDPTTWGTFDEALAAYQRGGFDGISFAFSEDDPYAGVDLDSCRDTKTGRLEPWAAEIVEQINSYTEASPSGTGVHIIAQAILPPEGRKNGKIEMYDSGRFFTMTGGHIDGTPITVEDRQAEITALHARIFSAKKHARQTTANGNGKAHSVSDEEILTLARHAKNGDLFTRLFAGDWTGYPSQSEADQALCNLLAFWCGHDPARVNRLFQQSGLYRKKWDERHFSGGKTYGEATIEKALAGTQEFYKRKETGAQTPTGQETTHDFKLTDLGNAERLVSRHGENIRFCNAWGKWLVWSGAQWQVNNTQEVNRLARETIRAIYAEAAVLANHAAETEDEKERKKISDEAQRLFTHALKSERWQAMRAMTALAEMDCQVLPDDLDADPWLLNVLNGTLDLRTGKLRSHTREDLLTKLTPITYDAEATCPTWESFLETAQAGKQDVIDFLQRAIGYSLTGDTREQCLFLLHGVGANGKSTFIETLSALLTDYAEQADFSSFLHKDRDGVRNDLAKLRGARFVAAVEVEEDRRLAEVVVKQLTGGDTITARFLFHEYFNFKPQFKLWLAANHKPIVRGTDHAIWRRIRLVPFTVTIPESEQDPELLTKLKAELPGILAWAVRGCLAWQREGRLMAPDAVQSATAEYRAEMDLIGAFLDECCTFRAHVTTPASVLYEAYAKWCERGGEKPLSQKMFGARLRERGLENQRNSITSRKQWRGIAVKTDETEPSEPS